MENLLISACLLGVECGGSNALPEETIEKLRTRYRLIPVCPETAGGLPTPRDPSERLGERVVSCRGADVTAQFKKGAEAALTLARRYGCTTAGLFMTAVFWENWSKATDSRQSFSRPQACPWAEKI